MEIICYKKCGTCNKLEKQLNEKGVKYTYRHIDVDNPTKEEIKLWHEKTGLDIKRFFNTSGRLYKEMNLKEKLNHMTLEEKYDLLASDGLLVKRPIILLEDQILIGPDAKKYGENL